jgi:hypothetical protein
MALDHSVASMPTVTVRPLPAADAVPAILNTIAKPTRNTLFILILPTMLDSNWNPAL